MEKKELTKSKTSRGHKRTRAPKRKFNGDEVVRANAHDLKDTDNDVSWYTKNEHLLHSAASLPYNYPVGSLFDITNGSFPNASSSGNYRTFGGILTLDLLTGPGIASNVNDPVNIAARDIYSWVRYANSGHANYDPQDLVMYYLAWDEVSMWIENAKRAYGAMFTYNAQNRYAPKFLVQTLGWDYNDLNANLAQFRYAINSLIARFNALNVPKTFSYFMRHKWLYSNIYTDSTTAKAQLYVLRPTLVRRYVETGDAGGRLEVHAILNDATQLMTVSKFVTISNALIDALLGSEDIGIMSGDTLKAFGSDKCWVTELIPENYHIYPVYNQEVLSQIQNATILGVEVGEGKVGNTSWAIKQNPDIGQGIVVYDPIFDAVGYDNPLWQANELKLYSNANRILSTGLEAPQPGDTMVSSRLACITKPNGEYAAKLTSAGDAVVVRANVWELTYINGDVSLSQFLLTINGYVDRASVSDPSYRNLMKGLENLSNFDYHPMDVVAEIIRNGSEITYWMPHVFFDVDNYTVVNPDVLGKLHETALLAEFDVPIEYKAVGKF